MSIIKRRGRIVSFRVSEEEYLNLCQATDASGARSISDFARHITCHHSLVLAKAAGSTNGNGGSNGNDHPLASMAAASFSATSINGPVELHPAPAMALEVSRLRERLDEISRQMQVLTRRVSRSI